MIRVALILMFAVAVVTVRQDRVRSKVIVPRRMHNPVIIWDASVIRLLGSPWTPGRIVQLAATRDRAFDRHGSFELPGLFGEKKISHQD